MPVCCIYSVKTPLYYELKQNGFVCPEFHNDLPAYINLFQFFCALSLGMSFRPDEYSVP